jgi:hypothetical protein
LRPCGSATVPALWAEFTRQAQVDTPSAPTVSRKHDYIEGEVDMDAAAEAVLRVSAT